MKSRGEKERERQMGRGGGYKWSHDPSALQK